MTEQSSLHPLASAHKGTTPTYITDMHSLHIYTDMYRHAQPVLADAYFIKKMVTGCNVIDCKVSVGKQ